MVPPDPERHTHRTTDRAIEWVKTRILLHFAANAVGRNKSETCHKLFFFSGLSWILGKTEKVPGTGLEPAHLSIPEPKSGASTNFATPACPNEAAREA
jgi:hypothetical protein